MKINSKLILLIKIVIVFLIFYILFESNRIDFSLLFQQPDQMRLIFMKYLGILLIPISMFLLALRWQQSLKLFGVPMTVKSCLKIQYIAHCFMIISPGVLGVEAVKILYLIKYNKGTKKTTCLSISLVDRFVGLYGLFLIGTVGSLAFIFMSFTGNGEMAIPNALFYVVLGPILLSLGTTMAVPIITYSRFKIFLGKYKQVAIVSFVLQIVEALHYFKENKVEFAKLVGLSVVNHAIVIFIMYCIGVSIGDSLSLFNHFMLDSIGLIANVVPITPGGLGISESVFSFIFNFMGSNNGSLIMFLLRIEMYAVFLVFGLPLLLADRKLFSKATNLP